jgi:hypothetical protein
MPPKRVRRPAPRAPPRTNTYPNIRQYVDEARAFFSPTLLPAPLRISNYRIRKAVQNRTAIDQYRATMRGQSEASRSETNYGRITQVVRTTDPWYVQQEMQEPQYNIEDQMYQHMFSLVTTGLQQYRETPTDENGTYTRRMQFTAELRLDYPDNRVVMKTYQLPQFDYTTNFTDLGGSFEDYMQRLLEKLSEYEADLVSDVSLGFTIINYPPRMLGDNANGGLETQRIGNAQFFCYNTPTETNCLWVALAFATAPDRDTVAKYISESGKRTRSWTNCSDYIKRRYIGRLPDKERVVSGEDSVRAFSEGERRRIFVHDQHFNVLHTYTPETTTKPDAHIMLHQNHYIGMVANCFRPDRFDDYQTMYGETGKIEGFFKSVRVPLSQITDVIGRLEEDIEASRRPYSAVFEVPSEMIPNLFSTFDFETAHDKTLEKGESSNWYPYACGVNTPVNGYKAFWGMESCQEFMDYLWGIRKEFRIVKDRFGNKLTHTMYAHNGAGFDMYFILRHLMTQKPEDATWMISSEQIINDGRYLRVTIYDPTDISIRIQFQDSMAYFPQMPLAKIAKEYKCATQKGTFPHDKVNIHNWHEYKDLCEVYLKDDCIALYEVLQKHEKAVWDFSFSRRIIRLCPHDKHQSQCRHCKGNPQQSLVKHARGGVMMTQVITAASIAKRTYFVKYYDRFNWPIYTPTEAEYSYMKRGYMGGRNEMFIPAGIPKHSKVYYKDFTSLYPAVAAQNDLPAGKMSFVQLGGVKATPTNIPYGMIRCMVRTLDFNRLPLHLYKEKSKCYFAHYVEPIEMTLYSEEIKVGLQNNMYEYHLLDAITYELKVPLLRDVMTDAFKVKQEQTELGNSGLALSAKIVANSTYGFWGTNVFNKEGGKIEHKDVSKLEKAFMEQRVIDVSRHGDYFVSKQMNDLPSKDINIGVACAITSLARMKLWELMDDIKKQGGEVYYCDTDSVITSIDTDKNEFLRKKYNPSGTGKELGELKCEITDKLLKDNYCTPEQISEVGNHMDGLAVGALKCYGMIKNHPLMRKPMEISTQKGGNKKTCKASDYFDTHYITVGDEQVAGLKVEHDRWVRGGLSAMFRDTEEVFHVRFEKGCYKNIRFQYEKAKLSADGLRLEPFVWTQSLGFH